MTAEKTLGGYDMEQATDVGPDRRVTDASLRVLVAGILSASGYPADRA